MRSSSSWEESSEAGARWYRGRVTAQAALLVLASAMLHAVWNAIVKKDDEPRTAGLAVLTVATALAVLVAAASSQVAFPERRAFLWALGAGAFEEGLRSLRADRSQRENEKGRSSLRSLRLPRTASGMATVTSPVFMTVPAPTQ